MEKGLGGTPYFAYAYLETGTRPMERHHGDSHSITLAFFFRDYTHYCYDRAGMVRLRNAFIGRVNADPAYLGWYEADWLLLVQALEKAIARVEATRLASLSDQELYALYEEYFRAWEAEYGPAYIYQDPFSMDAHNYMPSILEKYLPPERFQEYYSILFAPVNESFINSEKKDLLHIAQLTMGKGVRSADEILGALGERLEAHSRKYFWIENNYAHTQVLPASYFAQKIADELASGTDPAYEIRKIMDTVPENIERKSRLIQELGLPQDIIQLIRIAERFTFMQDERKKYVLISCHYLQKFLEEFSRRSGLPLPELRYAIHPEIKDILLQKYDRERLRERLQMRYHGCLCVNTPEGFTLVEGPAAADIYRLLFKPHVEVDEFKGICASRGRARGPVRIILTIKDLGLMQKGDILVTSMTRPEMVVAVKKAVAIVTDEGGITSHAAIVSREMGIPCVLATQVASKILKNGDIVEVNADQGMIRILERAR